MEKFKELVKRNLNNCIEGKKNTQQDLKIISDISKIIHKYYSENFDGNDFKNFTGNYYYDNHINEILYELLEILFDYSGEIDKRKITELIEKIEAIKIITEEDIFKSSIKYKDIDLNSLFIKLLNKEIFIENELNNLNSFSITGGCKKIKILKNYR